MFGKKPKGWNDLSEEDKAWAAGITKKTAIDPVLLDSIRNNQPARVHYVLDNFYMWGKERVQAAQLAIDIPSAEILKDVLRLDFLFFLRSSKNKAATRELFKRAAKKDGEVFEALIEVNNREKYERLKKEEIFSAIDPFSSVPSVLRHYLGESGVSMTSFLENLLLSDSPEHLKVTLHHKYQFSSWQIRLDQCLFRSVIEGKMEKTKLLLAHDATPDKGCLQVALQTGNREMVDLLLPRIDLKIYGHGILQNLAAQKNDLPLLPLLENALAALEKRDAPPPEKPFSDGYTLVDEFTLAKTQKLPDGAMLTTLFNFESCQQSLVVQAPGQPPAPPTVTEFKNIGSQIFLERLRQKLTDLGGNGDGYTRLKKERVEP